MSIRTTVTLDEDVMESVKRVSRERGVPFREALNDLIRLGIAMQGRREAKEPFAVEPVYTGYRPGLNLDKTNELIEWAEGPLHR